MPTVRPPSRRTAQARLFRAVNIPMRLVLSLPFPTPVNRCPYFFES
jgi:hypothetical protein